MPNKTIYVSEADEKLFEQAKGLAGEALSSVIARALKEFVTRHTEKQNGMKDVSVKVGSHGSEREQRFVGAFVQNWQGFSNDREWWLGAKIYRTQKGNWAVCLTTICKASLLTDKKRWKESGDYLTNPQHSELIVGKAPKDLQAKLPHDLVTLLSDLSAKDETPVEFLDI